MMLYYFAYDDMDDCPDHGPYADDDCPKCEIDHKDD